MFLKSYFECETYIPVDVDVVAAGAGGVAVFGVAVVAGVLAGVAEVEDLG